MKATYSVPSGPTTILDPWSWSQRLSVGCPAVAVSHTAAAPLISFGVDHVAALSSEYENMMGDSTW